MSVSLVRPKIRLVGLGVLPVPRWLQRHNRRDYIIKVALSCPPWVDRKALAALQKAARDKSRRTGVRHVVDHIIPITHPYVCGLTVPGNLRVVPADHNAWRGNVHRTGAVPARTGAMRMRKTLTRIFFPIIGTTVVGLLLELSDGEGCIILILLFIVVELDDRREAR
jgi:hypothetical protein